MVVGRAEQVLAVVGVAGVLVGVVLVRRWRSEMRCRESGLWWADGVVRYLLGGGKGA